MNLTQNVYLMIFRSSLKLGHLAKSKENIVYTLEVTFLASLVLHYPRCQHPHLRKSFFKSLYFPDHLIVLVHICYDDRYSSKVLFSNTQAHYLKVKVMDLEIFNVKVFLGAHFFQSV